SSVNFALMMRATWSVGPPAAKDTVIRTGFDGYRSCASKASDARPRVKPRNPNNALSAAMVAFLAAILLGAALRDEPGELLLLLGLHAVGVLAVGKLSFADFTRIFFQRRHRDLGNLRVAFREFRLELIEDAQQVEREQQLPAARAP